MCAARKYPRRYWNFRNEIGDPRWSFFEARAKFELKLTLTSEAPEAPLFWAVDAPSDLFRPAVDVERVVGAACERYTRGFGRLCDIYCAIDAQMRAPRA